MVETDLRALIKLHNEADDYDIEEATKRIDENRYVVRAIRKAVNLDDQREISFKSKIRGAEGCCDTRLMPAFAMQARKYMS